MATFTVLDASVKKTFPPDPEKNRMTAKKVIALSLQGESGATQAEWFTDATTTVPEPGTTLAGDLETSQYGLKFKAPNTRSGGGGGGGGAFKQTHPVDAARMSRSHAQEMALRYMEIKVRMGVLTEDFKPSDLFKLIDWFDADARQASEPYGQAPPERRKDFEKTGESDVPVSTEDFVHTPAMVGAGEDPIPF